MKYTVNWSQEVTSGDYWYMGEVRDLTPDQVQYMETSYPGCITPAHGAAKAEAEPKAEAAPPEPPPEMRAKTPDEQRIVTKAPERQKGRGDGK